MLIHSVIMAACLLSTSQQQVNKNVIVSANAAEVVAAPGKKTIAVIEIRVKSGYHIQANKLTDASLIPVTLKIIQPASFTMSEAVFPHYKLFRLEGTTHSLHVFDNSFVIRLPFQTPVTTKPGRYLIKAQLHYQACDATKCLFPRTLDLEIPVVVS